MSKQGDRTVEEFLHEGELEAQRRFGVEGFWTALGLEALLQDFIPLSLAESIEELPFFFIATANTEGECDCSFRGREHGDDGNPYPLVKILSGRHLVFPDYVGNRLFNSLGNIIVNGHIGMLFIDFETQSRVRINGRADVIEDKNAYANIWPTAQRYVSVTVEQFYGNCKSRIPHMKIITP